MRRNGSSFSTPLKVEGTKQTSKIKASAHFSSLYLTVDKSPSRLESPARRFRPETRHRLRALRFSDTRKLTASALWEGKRRLEREREARGSDRQQRSAPQRAMATAATAATGPLGGGSAVTAAAGAVAATGGQSGQFQFQFQRQLQRLRLQWHPAVVAVVALWRCIQWPVASLQRLIWTC